MSLEIPLTGPEAGAPIQKLLPGKTVVVFLDAGVIACNTYCEFERVPQPRSTFHGTFLKFKNYTKILELISFTEQTFVWAVFF